MRRKPAYILVESSRFTSDEILNKSLHLLHTILSVCRQDPQALETVHLSLIVYGACPIEILPLTSITEVKLPTYINTGYGCMLGKAMQFLSHKIKSDLLPMSSVRKGDWNPSLLLITSGESDDGFDGIDKYLKFYPATVIGTDITNHNVLESIQNKLFTSYFGTRPISGFIPNGNNPLILDNVFEHSNNLPYLLMERIIS